MGGKIQISLVWGEHVKKFEILWAFGGLTTMLKFEKFMCQKHANESGDGQSLACELKVVID